MFDAQVALLSDARRFRSCHCCLTSVSVVSSYPKCFLSAPHYICILSTIGAHAYTWRVDHRQEHLFTALMLIRAVIA